MLRFTALAIVFAFAVASAKSDNPKIKCMRLGHPDTKLCCKSGLPVPAVDTNEFKECMELPRISHSCERDICVAKKRGYASSDSGNVDAEAFEKIVAEDFKEYPDLIPAVHKNCINGDSDKYGSPHHEVCQVTKMRHCVHTQAAMQCKEWDDTGSCAGLKELAKECEAVMNE